MLPCSGCFWLAAALGAGGRFGSIEKAFKCCLDCRRSALTNEFSDRLLRLFTGFPFAVIILKPEDILKPVCNCETAVGGAFRNYALGPEMHGKARPVVVPVAQSGPSTLQLLLPCAILWDEIEGDGFLDEVVLVDQSPIGRTPRSNPVTYIKAFDIIREVFASLPEAQKRGLPAGHFSFNVPGGRCDNCQGDGTVTVEMQFLADVELICDECKGTRYKPQILEIHYKGKNIHEVLNLTIREALKFFAEIPRLTEKLRVLDEVGLGYLRLGQSATTLSGGEAQRMKLAAHLQPGTRAVSRPSEGGDSPKRKRQTLYIFDEPTTGLHFDDVSKLLSAFRRLIDAGGSIVVIEHNLEVIKTADWVIDLGPEGGDRGGNLVGVGPPEAIAELNNSYTGQYLKQVLNGNTVAHGER